MKYRLAVLETHPVQYRLGIYRELNKNSKIDLIVYFCSDFGLKEIYDIESNSIVNYSVNLEGFKYKFLKNFSLRKPQPPKGLANLGIINEIMKNNYDAVLIYGYSPATHKIATIFSRLNKTPVLFRDEVHEIRGDAIKKFLKKIIYRFWFKLPSAFLYSYTKSRDFYIDFGIKREKLFFVPCAVDNNYFQKKAGELKKRKKKLKIDAGIKNNYPIVLFVGKLSPRKRPFDLIKAYEKTGKNFNLIFVGEGEEKERIKNYAFENRLKNIYLAGFKKTEDLVKYYSIADIFVLTSEYDPSPKVLNEAMNFSLPVIISDKAGTAKDLVKQNKNGFIYKCGNINELARYLNILSSDKNLMKNLGKESLKIVSEWNFKKDVKGILDALDYLDTLKNGG